MKAEATITIRGEELVITGEVKLPRIFDHNTFSRSEVTITGARLDTLDEPPIARDFEQWNDVETREVEEALVDDAVNTEIARMR